ncbi:MAG: amidoligase family protein [Planctomycetota bacterium]
MLPTYAATESGALRQIGVEVEFAGLDLERCVRSIAECLDASFEFVTEYEALLDAGTLGSFRVEVDNHFLKDLGRLREEHGELDLLQSGFEAVLSAAIGTLTPIELVTPPLAPSQLLLLDHVLERLSREGAVGTQDGVLSAFGVHYNPRLWSLDPSTIWHHLQAYCALEPWLRRSLEVDLARRVSGFIQSYPLSFVERVISNAAPSDHATLVDEYLAHNPTRNRALDLLPLLTHLSRERVESTLGESDLSARPTFHFRLANSFVGDPRWSITEGWRHWLLVEDVAGDPERLDLILRHYRRSLARGDSRRSWSQEVERWLEA